ncbi:RtcB family protein [Streptomonospora salina]|uniref:RtcB family protein n=1 Tax=Streptomonospora salina TaxID=104205 RepID=UPI00336E9E7B
MGGAPEPGKPVAAPRATPVRSTGTAGHPPAALPTARGITSGAGGPGASRPGRHARRPLRHGRRRGADEIPAAYKDPGAVIEARTDLVEVVAHLRRVICVKG